VHVGRALIDRVHQNLVDVSDDRCVFRIRAGDINGFVFTALDNLKIIQVGIAEAHLLRFGRARGGLQRLGELVLLHQHRFGGVAGRELDLVQRLQIGWVRDGDVGFLAALEDRQCMAFAQYLFADFAYGVLIDVDGRQVDQRNPELDAGRLSDTQGRCSLGFHQHRNERCAVLQCLRLVLAGNLVRQHAISDESSRQAPEKNGMGLHCRCCCHESCRPR
jgi:hypothetical protein